MTKKKELEEKEIDEISAKEIEENRKTERFFSELAGNDSFEITVYREGDRGKLEMIEKYFNEIPDIIKDIRNIYGGGTYRFYANKIEDGKIIEQLDYTRTHLAKKLSDSGEIIPEPKNNSYNELVQNLTLLKGLFPEQQKNNNSVNEVLIAMMKSQNEISQNQTKMFQEQSERLLKFQLESEKRFSSMLEKMTEKKNGLGDIIETVQLIDSLRGSGDEKSLLEKFINSPLAAPIVENFLKQPEKINGEKISDEKVIEKKNNFSIDDYIRTIPEEMKNKINMSNKNDIALKLYEKNRDILTPDISQQIIDKILEMRETENGISTDT